VKGAIIIAFFHQKIHSIFEFLERNKSVINIDLVAGRARWLMASFSGSRESPLLPIDGISLVHSQKGKIGSIEVSMRP
jgi:hypothetical protein